VTLVGLTLTLSGPLLVAGSKKAPLMTQFGPPVVVMLILTFPEMFQTTYVPFPKFEIVRVSRIVFVLASTI
jgi:hypothetical protein